MRAREKWNFYSIILLVVTAGLHVMPMFFLFLERGFGMIQLNAMDKMINGIGIEALGEAGFGFIYLFLAVLIFYIGNQKIIQIMGFLIPLIGCFIAIGLLMLHFMGLFILNFMPLLIVMVSVDFLIVPIRFYVFKLSNKNIVV